MKFNFNNQFFKTVAYFVNGILSRHYFGYKQPWLYTKFATLLIWLGCTYTERERIEIEECEEYEDSWTEGKPLYLAFVAFPETEKLGLSVVKYPFIKITTKVEPPKVHQMPVLATSEADAWDRLEQHLWDNEDYETTILSIVRIKGW